MNKIEIYIGLDVHKETITAAARLLAYREKYSPQSHQGRGVRAQSRLCEPPGHPLFCYLVGENAFLENGFLTAGDALKEGQSTLHTLIHFNIN